MSKRAYEIWHSMTEKAKSIREPSGSGHIGDGLINAFLLPITIPMSLPLEGIAAVAANFFKHENQVVIPIWTPEGSAPTNVCVPRISEDDLQVVVVSDGQGGFTLPSIEATKGWADTKSLGMEDGLATWICDAWDDRRGVYVTYHLLMKGTVTHELALQKLTVKQLRSYLPEEAVKKIHNHPNYFESWKSTKFNLKFEDA